MIYITRIFIFTYLIIITFSCTKDQSMFIPNNNSEIEYWGRVHHENDTCTDIYWSGTSIKLNFEGKSIDILLKDEFGDNYFNVIIDNDSILLLRPDTTKKYYTLATELPEGKHSIEIYKRTEWKHGSTHFFGFRINGNPKLLEKNKAKDRKIEFYGNSITAGYAVEDTTGSDSPDSTYTNNYLSYAAITSRHFNAEFRCICRSGIGVTISWYPLIMPEMYNRLNPADTLSKWDFSQYTPDVVVVNLFQNDFWLVNKPEHAQFKLKFDDTRPTDDFIVNSYQQFIHAIRGHYPDSKIICTLGNMEVVRDSVWINYIYRAVESLNDDSIYAHIVPFKGTYGHPSVIEQQKLANSLIDFIEQNIDW